VHRKRHRFEVTISPTRPFRNRIQAEAKASKQAPNERQPFPKRYFNPNNDDGDDLLVPGGGGRVVGKMLDFDQAEPDQGIFLLAAGHAPRRVDVILKNAPSELIFLVPADLPAGEYTLEVRSRFGTEIRAGRLRKRLKVS